MITIKLNCDRIRPIKRDREIGSTRLVFITFRLIVKTPIMPEYPECLISGLLIWWFLLLLLKNKLGDTLFVLDLWADATAPELASAKRGSPESLGVPYRLNDKCKLKRGQRMSQKPLYPPPFSNSGQHISSYGLKLQAVEWNSRNVILNLGNIWLQV